MSKEEIRYNLNRNSGSKSSIKYQLVKRIIDIVGSALGLVLCAPLFFIVAILIKLTSRGPILARHERVGLGNHIFTLYKFRTMYIDLDDLLFKNYVINVLARGKGEPKKMGTFKLSSDPRITPIGKLLRKTRIDELPEFLNVLKGDMTLVGPIPAIPFEISHYKEWHKRRLEVKPGLTGLVQVLKREGLTFDDMVKMDLEYLDGRSLSLDFKLLLKTISSLLSEKNAT